MPGLIEIRRGRNGKYPVYPQKPVDLPLKKKLFAKMIMVASVISTVLVFVIFYFYAIYTGGRWVSMRDSKKEACVSEVFMFITPIFPLIIELTFIYVTYKKCFVTQFIDCGTTKSKYIYLLVIPCFLPMLLSLTASCFIQPIFFKLVNFTMCSLFATLLLGSWSFGQKHCQCKACLGIKDVKLHYGTQIKLIDEQARLNQAWLTNWFSIASSRNSQLALQLSNGEILHTFTRDAPDIQLKPGHYYVIVLEIVPVIACHKPHTCKNCEPAPTPTSRKHLLTKGNIPAQSDKTIMNVD